MASMNPSYYQTGAATQVMQMQAKEHLLRLYMFQHVEGNQALTANPGLAETALLDWNIRDGPGANANVVARAQGMALDAGKSKQNCRFICKNILFTDERFNGSSLSLVGTGADEEVGEWAIIGGTGEFTNTLTGAVAYKVVESQAGAVVRELGIRVLCLADRSTPATATKIGLLGRQEGQVFDVAAPPQRLETVTLYCGHAIDSIAFSYTDQNGNKQAAGPWGGPGGFQETILLAPSETLKKVFGSYDTFEGDTVLMSLTFVTNHRVYGPYGQASGTDFSVPDTDDNSSIVGFFARTRKFVDALGFYVRPIW